MSQEKDKNQKSHSFYRYFGATEQAEDDCAQCHYTPAQGTQTQVQMESEEGEMCPQCYYIKRGEELKSDECPQCHYVNIKK